MAGKPTAEAPQTLILTPIGCGSAVPMAAETAMPGTSPAIGLAIVAAAYRLGGPLGGASEPGLFAGHVQHRVDVGGQLPAGDFARCAVVPYLGALPRATIPGAIRLVGMNAAGVSLPPARSSARRCGWANARRAWRWPGRCKPAGPPRQRLMAGPDLQRVGAPFPALCSTHPGLAGCQTGLPWYRRM
ncbi:MAG: hypothetical protein ACK4L4_12175 [Gemmobacter sp.]